MVRQSVIAGFLAVSLAGVAQQQSTLPDSPQQQQAVPDAPRPQTSLPTYGTITPGSGTGAASTTDPGATPAPAPDDFQTQAPGSSLPSSTPTPNSADDGPAPALPAPGQGQGAITTFSTRVNFVQIPFTVKDSHNQLVPGITWREVRVYENNLRQRMAIYTTDAAALSVALVIDQSVTFDEMTKINNSLAALQGAFTPYDEVAVFTYNNGPRLRTDFTAAQSARLSAVLDQSKSVGRKSQQPSSPSRNNDIELGDRKSVV